MGSGRWHSTDVTWGTFPKNTHRIRVFRIIFSFLNIRHTQHTTHPVTDRSILIINININILYQISQHFFFPVALRPKAGHGLLILEVSHSVGILWTSDQLVAETSTWQHTTLITDKHPCPTVGFEPTISAGERSQTYALDRAATETGKFHSNTYRIFRGTTLG